MKKRVVVGIDLGTDSIKLAVLEAVQGEAVPRVLGSYAGASGGIKRGAIMEPKELSELLKASLDALEKSIGLKMGNYQVAVGGTGLGFQKAKGLVAVSRADGKVMKEDVRRATETSETNLTRLQNREILHKIPLLYKTDSDGPTYDPAGLTASKLEAETFFVTAFVQNIKNLLKTFDEADLGAEEIVASPLAASKVALGKREREIGAMALDFGAATTSIILFEEGLPYSLEIFPFGSQHITQDIAIGFKIDLDEAEKLKINYGAAGDAAQNFSKKPARNGSGEDFVYGNYSRKKLAEIIEARLSDIFELVEKHLKKVGRAGLLPAGVFIVGGGANLPGIESSAKDYLKLPAKIAEPSALGGFKDKVKNPAWSVAVGAALMGLEKESGFPFLSRSSNSFLKWLRAFLP